jgi:hypothetical protein
MKSDEKLVNNLKTIFVTIITSTVIWFGTFGGNQICLNFSIFFSIFVGIVLVGFIISTETVIQSLTKENLSNDFLHTLKWLTPSSIFIASGWIFIGLLWFLCWCVELGIRKKVKNND